MSKLKKILMMTAAYVLVAAIAIGGTVAYLTSEDSDVNVMTLGNVKIQQHEYERSGDKITSARGEGYELKEFTQAKPLYPATGTVTGWDSTVVYFDQLAEGKANGYQSVLEGIENVQDKFVLVENTGKSDAYVRTVFAFELGSVAEDDWSKIIMTNYNGSFWKWEDIGATEIKGNNYFLVEAIYQGSDVRHQGGVLPAGDYTYNSLAQVYMTSASTNEDVEKIDGNKNGTYDILVFTEAVQVAGFESADDGLSTVPAPSAAEIALDTAFGDVTVNNHPWARTTDKEATEIPAVVNNFNDLKAAGRAGGSYILGADLHITDKNAFFYGSYVTAIYKDMVLDLNGHSITIDVEMPSVEKAPVLFYVYSEGASLTVVGDGDIIAKHDAFIFFPRGVSEGLYIYGGNYYNNDDTSGTKNDINAIVYSQTNDNIHIYGGSFTFKNVSGHCGGFNVYDNSGAEIVLYEGVLLSNSNYYKGSDADEIHLAEGCTLKEVTIDGEIWYQVVKQ